MSAPKESDLRLPDGFYRTHPLVESFLDEEFQAENFTAWQRRVAGNLGQVVDRIKSTATEEQLAYHAKGIDSELNRLKLFRPNTSNFLKHATVELLLAFGFEMKEFRQEFFNMQLLKDHFMAQLWRTRILADSAYITTLPNRPGHTAIMQGIRQGMELSVRQALPPSPPPAISPVEVPEAFLRAFQ